MCNEGPCQEVIILVRAVLVSAAAAAAAAFLHLLRKRGKAGVSTTLFTEITS